jgi:hypothetical protein
MSIVDDVAGKPLALLLMCEDEAGEPEWWVVHGTLAAEYDRFTSIRSRDAATLPIEIEWLNRIRPVQPEQADVFAPSQFYLPLHVGALPTNADAEEYVFTGLQLHQ